jgi:hypothetical protein
MIVDVDTEISLDIIGVENIKHHAVSPFAITTFHLENQHGENKTVVLIEKQTNKSVTT